MSKESVLLETLQFLNITNKEEIIKLSANINIGFSFSKDGKSLIFESAFLSEGFRKGMNNKTSIFISEEEIKKSIHNSINKNFPVKFNHDYDTPSPGYVTRLYFDESKKMLMAVGKINHKETAEDIRHLTSHGNRIEVSVTVFGNVVWNKSLNRPELHNLRYNELSIVQCGEVSNTFIRMKN